MGKPKVPASSTSTKSTDLSRSRRRASQTKHRRQVASCYQRLRKCIPLKTKKPRKSSDTKRKVLNKVDVLNQSKEYILHLERALQNLIDKKKTTVNDCQNFDNAVARTIKNFDTVDSFRKHFGIRFEPRSEMSSYFDESRAVDIEKGMPTRSSQFSDDLGFVSGEGNSQEKCSTGGGIQNSQETNSGKLVRPYPQRSSLAHSYPYYGIYSNHSYFNGSHVLYYVPPIGYHAPYFIPYRNNQQGSQSSEKEEGSGQLSNPVYAPPYSPFIVPRNKPMEGVTRVSTAAEPSPEATESTTTSLPRLEVRYSYSKPDGKMSAPKICTRGQYGNYNPHPRLVVMKKSAGEGEEETGEYYSCLVPNSQ